ncbi:MAG: hypothetical protein ACLR23_23565 [Clostridia bacterium]
MCRINRARYSLPSSVWPILYRYDEPQMVVARAASTDDMTAAGKKTADLLNANAGIDTNNRGGYHPL